MSAGKKLSIVKKWWQIL